MFTSVVSDHTGVQPASSGKTCRSDRRNALEQAAEVALSSHYSPAAEGGWNQAVLKVRQEEGGDGSLCFD